MGAALAKNEIQTENSFDTTVINSAVNTFRQDAFVSYKNTIQSTSKINAYFNKVTDCNVNISLSQTIYDNAVVGLAQHNLSQVDTSFSTELTQDISKQLQQQNENLGMGSNVVKDAVTISNFIQNEIYNSFSESLNVVFTSEVVSDEEINVYFTDVKCGPDGSININANTIIDESNAIQVDQVLQALVENKTVNNILTKYNLKVSQKNEITVAFLLTLVLVFIAIALFPLFVKFVATLFNQLISGVDKEQKSSANYVTVLYFAFMLSVVVSGVVFSSKTDINWLNTGVASLLVILFFLLIIFG